MKSSQHSRRFLVSGFSDYENQQLTPEYHLWVAVVDRAIYDYSTFADWICKRQTYERKNARKSRPYTVETRMMRELDCLKWFLFSEPDQEFNLSWIMDHVFQSGYRMKKEIREKCEKAHETNLSVYAKLPQLERFFKLYEEKTGICIEPKSVDEIDITVYARPVTRRIN